MAENNIDLSAYNGQRINEDEYFANRRKAAHYNSRTRTASYPKPKWWDDNKYGSWFDCISTATSNYGDASTVTGTETFHANPGKYGFRKLEENERFEGGDIIQYYDKDYNAPHHGVVFDRYADESNPSNDYYSNYSNGMGTYKTNVRKNGYNNDDLYYAIGYRYVGTPEERAAIASHNQRYDESHQPLQSKAAPLKVSPLTQIAKRRQLMRNL